MDYKSYFKQNKAKLSEKEKLSIKIGGMITAARLHSSLSQSQLAKKINTQQPSIARAEKGEIIASLEFLSKIAKAINTELVIYFGFMRNNTENITFKFETISIKNKNNNAIMSGYYPENTNNTNYEFNFN